MDEENEGSLLIGVLLGFFLGCLGIVIAFVMKGSRTLTGSVIGMVLQIVGWICAGLGLVVLQVVMGMMVSAQI